MTETFPDTNCNVFRNKQLMTIIDNYFKKLQCDGMISDSHNTLSLEDIKAVFTHLNKLERTAHGYRDRLVFAVGLATGLGPTSLYLLKTDNSALKMYGIEGAWFLRVDRREKRRKQKYWGLAICAGQESCIPHTG